MRPILASLGVAAVFLLAQGSGAEAQQRQCPGGRTRIVGGEPAVLANWPGQAVFRRPQTGTSVLYFCGGTAVSDRWILTAAHCFEDELPRDASGRLGDKLKSRGLEVVLGSGDLTTTEPANVFPIERVVVHEGYRFQQAPTVGNDIALVRLARAWAGTTARLSLSATSDPVTPPRTQVRVAGFGSIEPDFYKRQLKRFTRADGKGEVQAGSAILQETAVETIPTDQCLRIMKEQDRNAVIGPGQVCAGLEQGGKDSCRGDSGGPLVITDEQGCPQQIGLVSWGSMTCAERGTYGVYTRVSHHADWIQKHTGPLAGAPPYANQAASNALTAAQFDEALRQLESMFGSTKGRVRIGVRGGNRVALGHKVVFEATSELEGRLIILDINANREVMLLYPNQFVPASKAGSVKPGLSVTVPGPDYPGFTSFEASEPVGKGKLLALVVPPDFDIERFVAGKTIVTKGFVPRDDPPTYLMRFIWQVAMVLNFPRSAPAEDALKRWAYAMAEYEIIR